jgi:chorismate mutase
MESKLTDVFVAIEKNFDMDDINEFNTELVEMHEQFNELALRSLPYVTVYKKDRNELKKLLDNDDLCAEPHLFAYTARKVAENASKVADGFSAIKRCESIHTDAAVFGFDYEASLEKETKNGFTCDSSMRQKVLHNGRKTYELCVSISRDHFAANEILPVFIMHDMCSALSSDDTECYGEFRLLGGHNDTVNYAVTVGGQWEVFFYVYAIDMSIEDIGKELDLVQKRKEMSAEIAKVKRQNAILAAKNAELQRVKEQFDRLRETLAAAGMALMPMPSTIEDDLHSVSKSVSTSNNTMKKEESDEEERDFLDMM